MDKKPLIGIILCILLLCMMPMISAVECKTIEKTQDDITIKKSEICLLKRVGDFSKKEVYIKHPILFVIILLHLLFRDWRGQILLLISAEIYPLKIIHPLLFVRAFWLSGTAQMMMNLWMVMSDSLGWNWPYF